MRPCAARRLSTPCPREDEERRLQRGRRPYFPPSASSTRPRRGRRREPRPVPERVHPRQSHQPDLDERSSSTTRPRTRPIQPNRLADDYVQPAEITNDRDNFDLKLTFQRSPSHNIWTKISMLRANVIDNFSLELRPGQPGDTKIYVGGLGHTWTLSPSLVLDGNFGINRQDQHVTGPDYGENLGTDVLGIPGTNGSSSATAACPHFDIDSTTTQYDLGTTPNWMPLFRHERSYTFGSALTWVKGRHQVRTGLRHRAPRAEPLPGRVRELRRRARRLPVRRPGTDSSDDRQYIPPRSGTSLAAVRARPGADPAPEGRPGDRDDGPRDGSTACSSTTTGTSARS